MTDQGIGIATERPRPDLRALLPGRPGPVAGHRRHRARPRDRQAHRHQPRRSGRRRQHARRGLDVHPAAARQPAGGRAAAAAVDRADPRRSESPGEGGQSRGTRTRGRGRGVVLRRPVLHAAQGGLRGLGRRDRHRGAHRVRPHRRRHRAARPDAAGDVRHRGLPAAAAAVAGADHHGHRAGQRDRQGGRPGDRRRRLRHQAVLAARAGRPHPRGAAPAQHRGGRAGRRRRWRPARCGWTSTGTW